MTQPKNTSKKNEKKSKPRKRNPLNTNDQVRTRREYIDYDYVNQLDNSAKKFLQKFTDEYYGGGGFRRQEDDTYNYKKNVHKNDELRRECYRRNTRQNKDIYNLTKISGKLQVISEEKDWDRLADINETLLTVDTETLIQKLHDQTKDGD
jgi:hypothetical protein